MSNWERLRESKARYEAEQREAGIEAGRTWAENDAEFEDLRTLERTFEGTAPTMPGELADAIGQDAAGIFGDDCETASEAFVSGFFEGAMEGLSSVC